MIEYAAYKGDRFIATGTKQQMADMLNIKVQTIEHYTTPTYQKRTPRGNAMRVIKIEE